VSANVIHWLTDDGLAPQPGLPAIYVFDDAAIARHGYGLQRLGFIYETLLEIDCEIWRGPTVDCVRQFAERHRARGVSIARTPCPWVNAIATELSTSLGVAWLDPPPFIDAPRTLDLTRYSRYWRKVEASALRKTRTGRE